MLKITDLPDDVLITVFSYVDAACLRLLCRVCRRFRQLATADFFWYARSRTCLATNQISMVIRNRSCCLISSKEKCRVALNWKREKHNETSLLHYHKNYMPWLQMTSKEMWVSQGTKIVAYEHKPSGRFGQKPLRTVFATSNDNYFASGEQQDVCKFVVTGDDLVVASGSEGGMFVWSPQTRQYPCFALPNAHGGATNGLAICSADIVLCGSKDYTVKVWKLTDNHELDGRGIVHLKDRVWSVAANVNGDMFVAGTAGCYDHPAILFSTETRQTLSCLGHNYKFGAGVLHCHFESNHSLFTTGYDTYIRLWDTRTPQSSAVSWENPYDLAVYCLSSDQNMTFISGSAAHGLVWLWDKRSTNPVQMYYVGDTKSPVYSLTFDPYHLYVALDHSLCMLSFT